MPTSSLPITVIVNNVVLAPPPSPPTTPFGGDVGGVAGSSAPARTTPTLQNFASQQIAVPFQIGQSGSIDTVSNLSAVAAQEISTILSTVPGSRVMRPTFGSSAYAVLFEPIQDDLDGIAEQLREALAAQVQNSTIQAVSCAHDFLVPSQINITVSYQVGPFPTTETTVVSVNN